MGAYDKQFRTRTYRARESSNYYRTDRDRGVCVPGLKLPPRPHYLHAIRTNVERRSSQVREQFTAELRYY